MSFWTRPKTLALCVVAALWLPATAAARQPPQRFRLLRPRLEYTTWIGLGGGALVTPDAAPGVFDLRLGGDFTAALNDTGHLRLGPFVEGATSSFAGVQAVGGVELFLGAVPRPLRMFYYSGEGVFLVRLGAGVAWRGADLGGGGTTPVASMTVAWGYRAPFSLREFDQQFGAKSDERAPNRYMIGVRVWVNSTVDLSANPSWQLTGGLEFEPVGGFRYLLGMY